MEAVYKIWWSLLHSKAAKRAKIKFWEMYIKDTLDWQLNDQIWKVELN